MRTAKSRAKVWALGVLLYGASVGLAQANLFINGGFETGNTFGWTLGGGGVDVVGTGTWAPSAGSYSLDLNAFTPGSISQTISTIAGQSYILEFDLSGNFSSSGSPNPKTFDVTVGSSITPYSFSEPAGWATNNMQWTTIDQSFIATGSTTTISFASNTSGAEGAALDSISVTEVVPEPASLALIGVGLLGLGFSKRKKA